MPRLTYQFLQLGFNYSLNTLAIYLPKAAISLKKAAEEEIFKRPNYWFTHGIGLPMTGYC